MARKKRSVTFASNTEGSRANRAFLLQFNALKCVCVCVFLCESKLLFALGKIRAAKCNVECFDSLTVIAMVTLIFHDTHSQSNVYACGKKMQLRSQRQCAILIRLDSFFSLTPRIFFSLLEQVFLNAAMFCVVCDCPLDSVMVTGESWWCQRVSPVRRTKDQPEIEL